MSVVVEDSDFTLHVGDVREVLATLPDESVHCVVTSPPYWGLRDYGTGSWDGGNEDCDHKQESKPRKFTNGRGEGIDDEYAGSNLTSWTTRDATPRDVCGKCGARRIDNQLGLEPTPDEYVANMVNVFREVRRVLRRDGTCWINLGDSYANDTKWGGTTGGKHVSDLHGAAGGLGRGKRATGLKAKDLVGVPWKVAFALQADGWYLRSDIIWAKPNPMPESVTDRPTKAHEYLFLLTRESRYFYDADAIREMYQPRSIARDAYGYNHAFANQFKGSPTDERHPDGKVLPPGSFAKGPDGRKVTRVVGADGSIQHRDGEQWPNGGRNKRSVWEIATQPYPQAHFATFPEALVEPCVLAGCPEYVCAKCHTAVSGFADVSESSAVQESVRGMRDVLRGPQSQVLLDEVLQEGVGQDPTEAAALVRSVPAAGGESPQPLLFAEVLGGVANGSGDEAAAESSGRQELELARRSGSDGGIRLGQETGPPERSEVGIHPGASPGDVSDVGPSAGGGRVGSSSQRGQGGQSAGEPGSDDEESASRTSDVSALQRDVRYSLSPCCGAPITNGVVLDPFLGSGTTALVARRLGRKTIGVELSQEYAQLAATRLQQLSLLAEPSDYLGQELGWPAPDGSPVMKPA